MKVLMFDGNLQWVLRNSEVQLLKIGKMNNDILATV